MTALLLSFVLGIGLSMVPRGALRKGFIEFRAIITRLIEAIVIPLLLHIRGIFLNLTYTGEAAATIRTLLRVVVVVLMLEVVILLIQFCVGGAFVRRNPLNALVTMMPAYLTALGTSYAAARNAGEAAPSASVRADQGPCALHRRTQVEYNGLVSGPAGRPPLAWKGTTWTRSPSRPPHASESSPRAATPRE